MAFTDKPLVCRECGGSFLFTAGEQEFYAQKGFTNEPGRCPECRSARRAAGGRSMGGGYDSGGGMGDYSRGPREMFDATCSNCHKETQVPFRPTQGKPVYCNECFAARR